MKMQVWSWFDNLVQKKMNMMDLLAEEEEVDRDEL